MPTNRLFVPSRDEFLNQWPFVGMLAEIGETKKHYTVDLKKEKDMEEVTIKNVIFNPPATIVFWSNGDKTVVKCDKIEKFDPEKGMAMAISKHALGNKRNYYNEFIKYAGEYIRKTKVNTKTSELYYNNENHEYVIAIEWTGKNYEEIIRFLDSITVYDKQLTDVAKSIILLDPKDDDLVGIIDVGDLNI
jgi:hypothetical protein|nr:MAG TPA: hypothetical protein [Caudoviricetes sp.]